MSQSHATADEARRSGTLRCARRSLVSATIAVATLLVLGCDKIPTWQEMTGGEKKAAPETAKGPVGRDEEPDPPSVDLLQQPVAARPADAATGPTQEELVARMAGLKPFEIGDAHVIALSQVESERTMRRELDLSSAQVTSKGLEAVAALSGLRTLDLSGVKLSRSDLEGVAKLPQLEALDLTGTQLAEADLEPLRGATHLQRLILADNPRISGIALVHLGGLPQLRELSLAQTTLIDQHLGPLSGLAALESLNVGYTGVTDNLFLALRTLPNLRSLVIANCKGISGIGLDALKKGGGATRLREIRAAHSGFGEAGYAQLAAWSGLEVFDGAGTSASDRFLAVFKGKAELRELRLSGSSGLTNAGIAQLKGLPKLQTLHLDGCGAAITDPVFFALLELPSLETLRLANTGCTAAQSREFVARRPNVKIDLLTAASE